MRLSRLAATLTMGALLTFAGTSCGSTRASNSAPSSSPPVTSKPLTGICKELFDFTNAPGASDKTPAEKLAAFEKLAPLIPPELKQAYADLQPVFESAAKPDAKATKPSAAEQKKQAAAVTTFATYLSKTCGVS